MADQNPGVDKAELARKVLSMDNPVQMQEALKGHDDLIDELMGDYEAFAKKYTGEGQDNPPESTDAPPAQVSVDEDEVVELKLPKKLLGTYKDGETFLRSVQHKDEVILTLRDELAKATGTSAENIRLKKLLEEHKANPPAPPVAPVVVDVDTNFEGDLLDEDVQKKFRETMTKLAEANKALNAKVAALESGVTNVSTVVNSRLEDENETQRKAAEAADLLLAKKLNPGVFVSDRPIEQIMDEYNSFLSEGSRLLGFDGTVYDANGAYTEGAKRAFQMYHDDKAGADFKEKLKAANIDLPADYTDIQRKNDIGAIYEQYKDKGMTWADATTLYASKTGLAQKLEERKALDNRKKGAETYAKAVDNRKQYATEIRPSEGAPSTATLDETLVTQMIDAYASLIQQGKDTTHQKESLKTILVNGGMDSAEVDVFLESFRKKE